MFQDIDQIKMSRSFRGSLNVLLNLMTPKQRVKSKVSFYNLRDNDLHQIDICELNQFFFSTASRPTSVSSTVKYL